MAELLDHPQMESVWVASGSGFQGWLCALGESVAVKRVEEEGCRGLRRGDLSVGLAAVAQWEKQHGRFTKEEMNEARRTVRAQLRTSREVRRSA